MIMIKLSSLDEVDESGVADPALRLSSLDAGDATDESQYRVILPPTTSREQQHRTTRNAYGKYLFVVQFSTETVAPEAEDQVEFASRRVDQVASNRLTASR